MGQKHYPESIENDWNLLYSDYPEIYDRFGRVPKQPTVVQVIQKNFPLQGKDILDIGSGSGLSTFELAQYAGFVTGIEPEAAMRRLAEQSAGEQGITNVRFIEGTAEHIPLPANCVDGVTAVTLASLFSKEAIAAFTHEAERVTRPGGFVLSVDIASGWYGGDLAEVIVGTTRLEMGENLRDTLFPRFGYQRIAFFATQDYGTVENAVQTYGFIFGKRAIAHLRQHNQSVITWKIHIHYKIIEAAKETV